MLHQRLLVYHPCPRVRSLSTCKCSELFCLNSFVHVFNQKMLLLFTCFADREEDNESKSKGEDGVDLEAVFDDMPLDNHDIQPSPPMQFSPIPKTPPVATITTFDVHRPPDTTLSHVRIFCLDIIFIQPQQFQTKKFQYFPCFTGVQQTFQPTKANTQVANKQPEQQQ